MQYASSLCEPIKWRSAFLGICHCKPKILFSRRLEEGRKVVKWVKWEVRVNHVENFEFYLLKSLSDNKIIWNGFLLTICWINLLEIVRDISFFECGKVPVLYCLMKKIKSPNFYQKNFVVIFNKSRWLWSRLVKISEKIMIWIFSLNSKKLELYH